MVKTIYTPKAFTLAHTHTHTGYEPQDSLRWSVKTETQKTKNKKNDAPSSHDGMSIIRIRIRVICKAAHTHTVFAVDFV